MQLSRFFRVSLSPCGKFYAVFNELNPEPLYLRNNFSSAEEINPDILLSRFGEIVNQAHLVVNSADEDDIFYEKIKRQLISKISDPFILYLNLASGCNFDCIYCPVPGLAEKHGEHVLTSKQADQAMRDWYELRFQNGAQTNYIIFYGGEPLLNKPVFKTSLEFLEGLRNRVGELVSLQLMIVTNGLLFDEETLSLCKQYGVTVVFGLDGITVEQNRTRLQGKNQLTHFAVLANIRKALNEDLRVAVSLTLTPYNIKDLDQIVNSLAEMGIKEIGFNFLKDASSIPELDTREDLLHFWKTSAVTAYKVGQKYFPVVAEFQYQKKIATWQEKSFFPLDCTCLGNQVVVQGDGYISNCPFFHRTDMASNNLHDFLKDDEGYLEHFRRSHPLWSPAYADLPEKALCGQGCSMAIKQDNQDASEPEVDWSSYFYSQEAFNDYLWNTERNLDSAAA